MILHIGKIAAFVLAALLFCDFSALGAEKPSDCAKSSVLIEADSGEIIFEKDAHTRRGPASTTKIMTALVALEALSPDTKVKVDSRAVGVEGSSVYLRAGETLPLSDLLYSMMLSSANDAAAAIAYAVAGDIDAFAGMMNGKAASLGLADTHFDNPHGLDGDTHYTTAYELALIARAALGNAEFAKIVATKTVSVRFSDGELSRTLRNHNRLLFEYSDIIGVKTGFTKKCGRTLVSAAERDGVRLICVTLCDGDDWNDHRKLLDAGFELYERVKLCEKAEYQALVHVCGGEAVTLNVKNEEALYVTLKKTHGSIRAEIELPPFVYAGIEKGQAIGRVKFMLDGREIGSAALYSCESCAAKHKKRLFG